MKSEAKYEAIRLMDRMFNIPEGYSNGVTNMLVESIIKAAVYECRAELSPRTEKMKAALERIRDCDWVISLPDRMDAVRDIAREALE
jgi:hypothetical protein